MEEAIVTFLKMFVEHIVVGILAAGGGLLVGFLLHRPHFRRLQREIDELKNGAGGTAGVSREVDDRIDYVTAVGIIRNYLSQSFEDVELRIQLIIVQDLLHSFERSPQAKIGNDIYSRAKLRVWLEYHMGKLLIEHRSKL